MNKIYLSNDDINWLFHWRNNHFSEVRNMPVPVKTIEISLESGLRVVANRTDDILKFHVADKSGVIGNITYEVLPIGKCGMTRNTMDLPKETKDGLSQDILSMYASLMALMVYGNIGNAGNGRTEKRNPTTQQKKTSRPSQKHKRSPSITYILKRSGGAPSVIVSGSHRSPNGEFTVRGHYRHYKNGRTVWIAEYSKGTGKKKSKRYKIKPDTPKP